MAVINETLARKFFPGLNPVGRTYQAEGEARKLEAPVLIVGLAKDAKYEAVQEATLPTVFRPLAQIEGMGTSVNYEIRAALPVDAVTRSIQKAIADVNKGTSVEIHALAAQVDDSMTRERMLATLAAFFGALALLLATIGLYGTLSYLVTQRRVEFGIRMALGAQARAILGLVMGDVVLLLIGGLATGMMLSLASTRFLRNMLFGLEPRDAATLILSAALLCFVCIGASLMAARRATKVDPMTALRHD